MLVTVACRGGMFGFLWWVGCLFRSRVAVVSLVFSCGFGVGFGRRAHAVVSFILVLRAFGVGSRCVLRWFRLFAFLGLVLVAVVSFIGGTFGFGVVLVRVLSCFCVSYSDRSLLKTIF